MAELKKHFGGCHCKKVRFEVSADTSSAMACNCSICSKKGTLLSFAPEEQFKLISGEGDLSDYLFGEKTIHHLFCKHCGVTSFARGATPDGKKMVAINVRCLDDFTMPEVKINEFNGKAL